MTSPGRGYRFAAEVHRVTQEGDDVLVQSRSRSQLVIQQPDKAVEAPSSIKDATPLSSALPVASQPASRLQVGAAWRPWVRLIGVAAGVVILTGAILAGYQNLRPRTQQRNRTEAAREYQLGRELWKQRHADSISKAIEHYERAVALDASYAPVYSGLADAYLALPLYSSIPKDVLLPKALKAAEKAVALDPSLAEAHISLGDAKAYSGDLAGADPEYRRGIELNPNYTTGHQWYANYLSLMGRHQEAIEHIVQAVKFDPLSLIMNHNAGQIYYNARQYNLAIAQFNKALQIDPAFYPACIRLADALRQLGMYREAIEAELEFYRHHGTSIRDVGTDQASAERLLRAFEAGGKKEYWRTRLEIQKEWTEPDNQGLTSEDAGPMYALAIDYAQNGDVDGAMLLLNNLVERHEWDMYHLKTEPDLDPLRTDPRFQELLRKIGFL